MTEEQLQMISDCQSRESKLTEWEANFIDSITNRLNLTQKQDEHLEKIWQRVTS